LLWFFCSLNLFMCMYAYKYLGVSIFIWTQPTCRVPGEFRFWFYLYLEILIPRCGRHVWNMDFWTSCPHSDAYRVIIYILRPAGMTRGSVRAMLACACTCSNWWFACRLGANRIYIFLIILFFSIWLWKDFYSGYLGSRDLFEFGLEFQGI